MKRRVKISVVGYNHDSCTKSAYDTAYQLGRSIAAKEAVVVCGGLGGVMEAACKGAHDEGGMSLGIVPSVDSREANKYVDIVVSTGLGHARNFLVSYSGDAVVVVGGGAGTLIEAAAAYQVGKPVVAIRGSGGVADEIAGKHLDSRKTSRIFEAADPEEAVDIAMRALLHSKREAR
jgi:uncharacterized protein (TIGR00725 family)